MWFPVHRRILPAPQTSPSPSSSPLSTHLMKTGPTARGKRKVKPVETKHKSDTYPTSRVPPCCYQVLPAVSFHIFHNSYHASQFGPPASLNFQSYIHSQQAQPSPLSSTPAAAPHTPYIYKSSPLPSLLFKLISSFLQPPLSRLLSARLILAPITPHPNPLYQHFLPLFLFLSPMLNEDLTSTLP